MNFVKSLPYVNRAIPKKNKKCSFPSNFIRAGSEIFIIYTISLNIRAVPQIKEEYRFILSTYRGAVSIKI